MVVYRGRRQTTWSRGAETGTSSPCSRNQSRVCRAEPSSKNLLNTSNTRSCTRRSGSFSRQFSPLTYPAGARRLVRHVWPSPVGPPSSVGAAGQVPIHSNCPSIPEGDGHCFAAACIPSLDRLVACPLLDRLRSASAIPDCCVQSATPLWPLPRPRAPSILPPPCVRSPPSSRYPMRIDRDPHRSLQCRASQGCTIAPAWHTAISDSPSCSELGTPRIGARRGSLFARHGAT